MDVSRRVRPVLLVITLTLLAPRVHPCPLTNVPDSWSGAAAAGVPVRFYPFGEEAGDTVREGTFRWSKSENYGDLATIDLTNQVSLPFLGALRPQLLINAFGFIFFGGNPFIGVDAYTTLSEVLFGEVIIINGTVSYRTTTDIVLLCRASQKVKSFFLDRSNYKATWMLVVTWRTSFMSIEYSGVPSEPEGETQTNTFQLVLVTDGRYTFALLNYGDITWPEPDWNVYSDIYLYVRDSGSNDYSGENDLLVLDSDPGNFGETGILLFRVDRSDLPMSGCDSSGSNININPVSGQLLGGKRITIAGPCFEETAMNIKCRFGGKVVDGTVDGDNTKAYCVTPPQPKLGQYLFELSVDGGATYEYTANYYAVYGAGDYRYQVTREGGGVWFNGPFNNLRISWITDILDTTLVDIHIVAIDRNGNFGAETLLLEAVSYSYGSAILPVMSPFTQIQNGVIRVAPTNRDATKQSLFSDVHPLRWYLTTGSLSPSADAVCTQWRNNANINPLNVNEVIIPPCTLAIMKNDTRFRPDPLCNGNPLSPNIQSLCQYLHDNNNVICYIAPLDDEYGQQACYGEDGNLIDSGPAGGGIVHWSYSRFGNLLHFLYDDAFPWVSCCDLGSADSCNAYRELRPTTNCTNYQPPIQTWTGGDPHYITLDLRDYTFNGYGEYWLIDSSTFKAQGRNAPVMDLAEDATFLTAVVFERTGSTKVEIRIDFTGALDLKLNDIPIQYDSLINPFPIDGTTEVAYTGGEELVVTYGTGETVTVRVRQGALSCLILLPASYRGSTVGLAGNFDQDASNDLRERDGTPVPASPTPEQIFAYGNTWRITEGESMFDYPLGEDHSDYQNESFEPTFLSDASLLASVTGRAVCGTNLQCLYDYEVTNDADFALNTKNEVDEFRELAEIFAEASLPCARMPCQSGGVCRNINGDTAFECDCRPDYTGSRCETSLFACVSQPCQNGGLCEPRDGGYSYRCDCPVAYTGINCETNQFACVSQPCQNGGQCEPQDGGYTYRCDCPVAYTGINCETDQFACLSQPCQNGGLCEPQDGGYTYRCDCPVAYTGINCETGPTPCSFDPCKNGGICELRNGSSNYVCDCRNNYVGLNCEISVSSACYPDPCENGATCYAPSGYPQCDCPPGYDGAYCHISSQDRTMAIIISVAVFGLLTIVIVIVCVVVLCNKRQPVPMRPVPGIPHVPRGPPVSRGYGFPRIIQFRRPRRLF